MKTCRTSKRIGAVLLAVMWAVLSVPVFANAHLDKGYRLDKRLVFYPQSGFGDTTINHFNQALWQWNKECDVYSLQRSTTTHDRTDFFAPLGTDQESRIYHMTDTSDDSPGLTITTYNKTTNKVMYANINLNMARPFSNGGNQNSYDVWTVFIHEAGHVLGFGHCSFYAVMNVYPMGTLLRYLTSEDKAALSRLYGT